MCLTKLPMTVLRKCPAWNGLAMLGLEYSTRTFLPLPMALRPKSLPLISASWTVSFRTRLVSMVKLRNGPTAVQALNISSRGKDSAILFARATGFPGKRNCGRGTAK
jgi:hypothetical protein